jgi:hypothetical protein
MQQQLPLQNLFNDSGTCTAQWTHNTRLSIRQHTRKWHYKNAPYYSFRHSIDWLFCLFFVCFVLIDWLIEITACWLILMLMLLIYVFD